MPSFTFPLIAETTAVFGVVSEIPRDVANYRALDDEALLELTRLWSQVQALTGTHAALAAGELARRSAPSLGSQGLAQRTGHRTPEELVRVTTGSTKRDAQTAVRVGKLAVDAAGIADPMTGEVADALEPWLAAVGSAMVSGTISVACAESIRNGLGEPTTEVTAGMLADAAVQLVRLVAQSGTDADRLYRAASDLRNDIDESGIVDRERARYESRSLRWTKNADGTARLVWNMDPETATIAGDLYDRATSPRRGGPRFVSELGKADEERIMQDARTTEQLASDVFVELLRQGADADSSQLLGTGAPVVTVYVTRESIERSGHARVAGQPEPVSLATSQRHMCSGGVAELTSDETGNPLDLEREQRLFSAKQKKVLAAKWGGCAVTGCERPASWTEAHHIQHWSRDRGKTNILDGILLCRHHHLLFHNNGWEITREGHTYWLIPPSAVDPDQTRVALLPKNGTWKELVRERAG